MGKLSNIMENGIAGLVSILEFRQQPSEKRSHQSPPESVRAEKESSLRSFVFGVKVNRKYLFIALVGAIVQFVVFKMLYPFPDFISDSYSYIATNIYHMDVNLWPIGYSKFLWMVHLISHSDTWLISIQYLLLEATLVYFFYSILYLYRPSKYATIAIFIFLFFNPLFLYLSNCVLSDAIFTALTLIFFAQFLWMLHKPKINQVFIQGIIIGLAFTIRYTAIYYPIIAISGFILSRQRTAIKIYGSLLGLILMIPFYLYTQQKTKAITGTAEFSVFGGWQIANNALYIYGHINVDSNKVPAEARELDKLSRQFFQQINPTPQELAALPGTYFIKMPHAILKPYLAFRYSYNEPPGQFHAWGLVSPIYKKFGIFLISHYPVEFAKYYLWLNTKNYFLPHLEKFGTYNLEINTVPSDVQNWFGYITPDIEAVSKSLQGKIFYIYPLLFMALNIYFTGYLIWLLLSRDWQKTSPFFKRTHIFLTTFLVSNFAFSVFATPVVLRYEVVPLILLLTFTALSFVSKNNINQVNKQSIK